MIHLLRVNNTVLAPATPNTAEATAILAGWRASTGQGRTAGPGKRGALRHGPAEFENETERLWEQVKPLYDELHCYVRAQLAKKYGKDKVPAGKPIPAHLLGNMWAQEWGNIYPLVEPYKGQASLDVDRRAQEAEVRRRSRW